MSETFKAIMELHRVVTGLVVDATAYSPIDIPDVSQAALERIQSVTDVIIHLRCQLDPNAG